MLLLSFYFFLHFSYKALMKLFTLTLCLCTLRQEERSSNERASLLAGIWKQAVGTDLKGKRPARAAPARPPQSLCLFQRQGSGAQGKIKQLPFSARKLKVAWKHPVLLTCDRSWDLLTYYEPGSAASLIFLLPALATDPPESLACVCFSSGHLCRRRRSCWGHSTA